MNLIYFKKTVGIAYVSPRWAVHILNPPKNQLCLTRHWHKQVTILMNWRLDPRL